MPYSKDEIKELISNVNVDFNAGSSKILQKLDSEIKFLKDSGVPVVLEVIPKNSQKAFAMSVGNKTHYSISSSHYGYICIDNTVNYMFSICRNDLDNDGNEISNPKPELFISIDHVEKGFSPNNHTYKIRSSVIDLFSDDGLQALQDKIISPYLGIIELKQLDKHGNLSRHNDKRGKIPLLIRKNS